jgi:hypothetical protein
MRDYAKLAPTFWTGETGKAIRRRGFEGVIVALYLVSAPGSNMLGLYYQPLLFMAHETGLGIEGASKGLQACIECDFCRYDEDTEMVFVHEMAAWQIAASLSQGDKRCKGIQKDYDGLPDCQFLGAFFDRYQKAFHLTTRREGSPGKNPRGLVSPFEAPSKPGTGTGTGAGAGPSEAKASAPAAPAPLPQTIPPPLPPEALEPVKPMTAKERVWAIGVGVFGDDQAARKRIGKLAGTYGDEVLADALAQAVLEKPAEAMSWVTAACEARKLERPKATNGHEGVDMLADPTPRWAIEAGFRNRFEAENEGCKPGNASKFREGRRVVP